MSITKKTIKIDYTNDFNRYIIHESLYNKFLVFYKENTDKFVDLKLEKVMEKYTIWDNLVEKMLNNDEYVYNVTGNINIYCYSKPRNDDVIVEKDMEITNLKKQIDNLNITNLNLLKNNKKYLEENNKLKEELKQKEQLLFLKDEQINKFSFEIDTFKNNENNIIKSLKEDIIEKSAFNDLITDENIKLKKNIQELDLKILNNTTQPKIVEIEKIVEIVKEVPKLVEVFKEVEKEVIKEIYVEPKPIRRRKNIKPTYNSSIILNEHFFDVSLIPIYTSQKENDILPLTINNILNLKVKIGLGDKKKRKLIKKLHLITCWNDILNLKIGIGSLTLDKMKKYFYIPDNEDMNLPL